MTESKPFWQSWSWWFGLAKVVVGFLGESGVLPLPAGLGLGLASLGAADIALRHKTTGPITLSL